MKEGIKRAQPYLFIALVIVSGLIAYSNALDNTYIWDDDYYVTENPTLRDLEGLRRIWFDIGAVPQYYPLVHTSFWIEYHLWQLRPFGYHLDNVLLHIFNVILLWVILRRLSVPGAWLAAVIFLLHPVHVESVAWITERKNVLSGFFYLSALLAYLRFSGLGPVIKTSAGSQSVNIDISERRFYFLALALFACALLSKTVTSTLPAAILLLLWWKRGRLKRRDVRLTAPFFIMGIGSAFLTVWMEKYNVGAIGKEWSLSFMDRIFLAGRALWFYAGKLFWPCELSFVYPRWQIDPTVWWQHLFPLAAAAVVIALWLPRSRLGKAPLVAVLYFAGTLAPALGFFNVYPMLFSFVADHFQYLASIGLIALFASGAALFFKRLTSRQRYIGFTAIVSAPIILGVLTWHQSKIYRDEKTLWHDTLSKNPKAWIAYNNLGVLSKKSGKEKEAIAFYEEAIGLNPDCAEAYNNLGNAYKDIGKKKKAISLFKKAIEINPRYANAYNSLGAAYHDVGNNGEAIASYKKAIELDPEHADAYNNLGVVCCDAGRKEEAISLYKKAIEINPDYAEAYNNLGVAYSAIGKKEKATSSYKKAIEIDPEHADAYNNLGMLYEESGKKEESIALYKKAIELDANCADAYNNLANAYVTAGREEEAVASYARAIEADPNDAVAYSNLGVLYKKAGKKEEAIALYEKAIELDANYADAYNNLANIYSSIDRKEEAIALYRKAIEVKPDYANAYHNLSAVYFRNGQYKLAVEYYDRAEELGLKDGALSEALKPYRE